MALAFAPLTGCRSNASMPEITPASNGTAKNTDVATDKTDAVVTGFEVNGAKWDGRTNLSGTTYNVLGD